MANVIEQWGCTSFISSVKLVIAITTVQDGQKWSAKEGKEDETSASLTLPSKE